MKRELKYWIITIIVSISLIQCNNHDHNKITRYLKFDKITDSIKVSAKVWGISANHSIVELTMDNCSDTVRFYTDQIFYKIEQPDILNIYVNSSSIKDISDLICSKIHLNIKELTTYDDISRIEYKYKEMGLERISFYDNDRIVEN